MRQVGEEFVYRKAGSRPKRVTNVTNEMAKMIKMAFLRVSIWLINLRFPSEDKGNGQSAPKGRARMFEATYTRSNRG